MALKKKVRHGSTSTAPEAVPHDLFKPRHPPNENKCDQLRAKCLIVV